MENKAPVEKKTLSASETAAYLGVSVDSIYEMVRKKQIPHLRIQSRILFRTQALEDWMIEEEKRNCS